MQDLAGSRHGPATAATALMAFVRRLRLPAPAVPAGAAGAQVHLLGRRRASRRRRDSQVNTPSISSTVVSRAESQAAD
eukprot:SAG22_NODE_66_length_22936_cov_626.714279_17_plen_78_part_00